MRKLREGWQLAQSYVAWQLLGLGTGPGSQTPGPGSLDDLKHI